MVKPARLRVIEESIDRNLIAELGKRQRSDATVVIFAHSPNVGDFSRPLIRVWFDVVELGLVFVFDRMIFNEAV